MKITPAWIDKWNACCDGREYYTAHKITDSVKLAEQLIKDDHFDWCNWMIVRVLNRADRIRYAVYAADQVLEIYEKKYPDDKRPRLAIEAARKCIEDKSAARAAADAARAAADAAAYAADAADAADAAAYAADAAYASYAADAADAAAYAADAAYASYAADAADAEMKKKILEYGIKLMKGHK